jgi:hypothetical protein
MLDVVLEVSGDALKPANRYRRFLDAAAAACGLARTIASASEDPREHIGSPIDHVGVAIAAFSNQSDVFWNWGVCGTGPLAIDNFMKVVGCRYISRFHSYLRPHSEENPRGLLALLRTLVTALFLFASHNMGLLNRGIQYDRRWAEKPFLPSGHSPLVWLPDANGMRLYVALQHGRLSGFFALIQG